MGDSRDRRLQREVAQRNRVEDWARLARARARLHCAPEQDLPSGALARLGTPGLRLVHRKVEQVKFLDGGELLASWSPQALRIWRPQRHSLVHELELGLRRVASLTWCRSAGGGPELMWATQSGSVWCTDPEREGAERVFQLPGTLWSGLCLAPNGATLGVWNWQSVQLWDLVEGRLIYEEPCSWAGVNWEGPERVWLGTFREARRQLIFRCLGGPDPQRGELPPWEERRFTWGHTKPPRAVATSPGGEHVLAYRPSLLTVWRTSDREEVFRLEGQNVGLASWSCDGRRLHVGRWGRGVSTFELAEQRESVSFFPLQTARSLAVSEHLLACVSKQRPDEVHLWDLEREQELEGEGHSAGIVAVAFSPSGGEVATAGEDGTVRAWEASCGLQLAKIPAAGVTSLAFRGANELTLAGQKVSRWGLGSGACLGDEFSPRLNQEYAVGAAGTRVWSRSERGGSAEAAGWDLGLSEEERQTPTYAVGSGPLCLLRLPYLPSDKRMPARLAVAARGEWLAIYDGRSVWVWSHSGQLLFQRHPPHLTCAIEHLALSDTGEHLVLGTETELEVWHLPSWQLVRRLSFQGKVTAVAFGAAGGWLAFARWASAEERKCVVTLLHLETGGRQHLFGHRAPVGVLQFSPDGCLLVSATRVGEALVWDLSRFASSGSARLDHLPSESSGSQGSG